MNNSSNLREMLPVIVNPIGEQEVNSVNARDLHKALNSRKDFSSWFKAKVKASKAVPEKDYTEFKVLLPREGERRGGSNRRDYIVTLELAKHFAMLENTDTGRAVRQYFIECEEQQAQALKELSLISYTHPEGLIFSIAGEIYTTSQVLAKVAGKQHYHILRDIREEIAELETNPNLDALIKDRILKGFKETTYKDSKGELRTAYQLSEEAFLQMSLRYSSEVRARFVVAFTSYRDALIDLYKARVLEKVIPQISTSRSFIYIIREEGKGRLKIGISNNPEKRLKTLQTGSAEDLTLVYTSLVCSNSLEIEAKVHEHFKDYLVRGEWFDSELNPLEIIKFLEAQTYVLESDFDLSFESKLIKFLNKRGTHL